MFENQNDKQYWSSLKNKPNQVTTVILGTGIQMKGQ